MPRLGIGMPLVSTATEASVLAVQDFFWLNDVPGELTTMQTADRTNIVPYSTGYSTARGWGATGANVTLNKAISPDKTQNASLVELGEANDRLADVISSASGGTYTFSFHVKAKEGESGEWVSRVVGDSSLYTTTSIDDSAWFRVSKTFTKTGEGNLILYPAYRLDGTSTLFSAYIWGVQLEQDSRVSAYIPSSGSAATASTTLNDTHNVWDFNGTDIVLGLDPDSEGSWERPPNVVFNHDFADLGAEEITNGDFATDTDWNKQPGWTISDGTANYDGSGNNYMSQNIGFSDGKTYKIKFDVTAISQGTINLYVNKPAFTLVKSVTQTGSHEVLVTVAGGSQLIYFYSANNFIGSIDNVSIKQVDPNDRWSTAGGWSIEGGKAVADGSQSTTNILYQDCGLVAGNTYTVSFSSNRVSGALFVKDGSTYSATTLYTLNTGTGPVVHEFNITKGSGSTLGFYAYSYGGSIDNITVNEYAAMPLDI